MYSSSITVILSPAKELCEIMSDLTEFKRTEAGLPLASEENNDIIVDWTKNRLEFEQKLSQNEQNQVNERTFDINTMMEPTKTQIPRTIWVRDTMAERKNARCISCRRPVEFHSEEPSLCAYCQQIPNLFLG
jgi:hypothetical protein